MAYPEKRREKQLATHSELEPQAIPLALQYFMAVDALTKEEVPDGRGYIPVYLYPPKEDQPRLVILRHVSKYVDGNTGVQDEIDIRHRNKRLQLNGEKNQEGVYIKYPESLKDDSISYIEGLIREFKELAMQDGAFVIIANQKRFIAKDGIWVPFERRPSKFTRPQLGDNQQKLPSGS